MLRIRTIKPGFFQSSDICAISAFARLLYIGLWCEAGRESRLEYDPKRFKRQFLPDDNIDVAALCEELIGNDLIALYGDGLAYIPTGKHQLINSREAASKLPAPPGADTCMHVHAKGEGKGRERKGKEGRGPLFERIAPRLEASRRLEARRRLPEVRHRARPLCRRHLGGFRRPLALGDRQDGGEARLGCCLAHVVPQRAEVLS